MIKKQKNKLLTLLIAGVVGTAALGGALATDFSADAAESTYSLSTIFSTDKATLSKDGTADTGAFKMEISDAGKVSYTRDLALKWYEKGETNVETKYMTMSFTFANTDFDKLTFAFETESLTATKDDKAINEVVFTNNGGDVTVSVNEGDAKSVNPTEKLTLSLAAVDGETDKFQVNLAQGDGASEKIGTFENIGSNFAEYDTSNKIYSFVVKAETSDSKKAAVLLHEINGQSLEVNENGKFTDNKAPVLVVNEDIDGFVLGTAFALDYEVIDVFDRTVSKTLKYYQYDPDDAAAAKKAYDESTETEKTIKKPEYKSLSTTTYFLETNYGYKSGDKDMQTSVYKTTGGVEYVSIQFSLTDDGENDAKYYLDWYLDEAKTSVDVAKFTAVDSAFAEVEGYTDIGYVKIYKNNEEGAKYTFVSLDETDEENPVNKFDDTNPAYTSFVSALQEIEDEGLSAGDGSYLYLPSMKDMLTDNGGYSNLKFTISYKTTSNNTARTSSGLSASSLKLEVTEAGIYEFKIFAVDKAGNNMKYYLDGELVDVTSSNVWDIEEIPSFSVKVANKGLSVEEESSRKESEVIYGTYELSDFDVIGPSSTASKYALFYVDETKVSGITESKLSGITYEDIAETAKTLKETRTERGIELYKIAYATELQKKLSDVTLEQVLSALVAIEEYNDKIDEGEHSDAWENSDNAYQWKPSDKSFVPQKMGNYLVLACFTDPDVPAFDAGAYKIVTVGAEEDVIYGETEWLKNNIVSVILFGVAGLMLILIIILLVVKPSDETLEDIDGETKKEKKEKKSKNKKDDEKALEELDVENK